MIRTSEEKNALSDQYKKKSLLEQILIRPDTYVGSYTPCEVSTWLPGGAQPLTYPPALYKIIDEILTNALDNKRRDDSMRRIDIGYEAGRITVTNDGSTVPVVTHRDHAMYIPTLVFGHLLTSDNYDDDRKRVTGGRNGYGAKLTNIFSTEFSIECIDARARKVLRQTWTANMTQTEGPVVRATANKKDRTTVRFTPDWRRFGLDAPPDVLDTLLRRRAYDIAGTSPKSLSVYYNGEKIPVRTFDAYAKQFVQSGVYLSLGERWEVVVAAKTDDAPPVPSFVNGICTHRGGSHVKHVCDPLYKYLAEVATKRVKGLRVRPSDVASFTHVFVNALVENPSFDSQTKDTLTSRVRDFGSRAHWTPDALKKCANKSGILQALEEWALRRAGKALSKAVGSARTRLVIPKLHDANKAGGVKSSECTLILTEGDSALALAIAGLSVVGRNKWGAFPLRGKLLNVRDASPKQVLENKEIQNVMKIIGLQPGNPNPRLRYGRLCIMTDQDDDGAHIGGLILNFVDHFWPGLMDGALRVCVFRTPLVKVAGRAFYSLPEYEAWAATAPPHKAKYYKGLGTSTSAEAKQYFRALDQHIVPLSCQDAGREALDLAFRRGRAADRRVWAANPAADAGMVIPRDVDSYVHKQLILYVSASMRRALCSLGTDGLKVSQRKILYTALAKNIVTDMKVAQFAPQVAEFTDYHHGEQSLNEAAIKMGQQFVGSNNVNLLVPSGQFGTRLMGGKDHASPRYVFTRLEHQTRRIFPKADDDLLTHAYSDGRAVEPKTYAPIVPMGVVNGSKGIATGWSATVPPHALGDVVAALLARLEGRTPTPLTPSWKGFRGSVERRGRHIITRGVWERVKDDMLRVTELPVGTWTQPYREWLETRTWVKRVVEHSTDERVNIEVHTDIADADVVKKLKLESVIHEQLVGFDTRDQLKVYDSVEQILDEFVPWRIAIYEQRLAKQVQTWENKVRQHERVAQFLHAVVEGRVRITVNTDEVERQLGFLQAPYDDLLDLPLRSLNANKLKATHNALENAKRALEHAKRAVAMDVWRTELQELVQRGVKRTRT